MCLTYRMQFTPTIPQLFCSTELSLSPDIYGIRHWLGDKPTVCVCAISGAFAHIVRRNATMNRSELNPAIISFDGLYAMRSLSLCCSELARSRACVDPLCRARSPPSSLSIARSAVCVLFTSMPHAIIYHKSWKMEHPHARLRHKYMHLRAGQADGRRQGRARVCRRSLLHGSMPRAVILCFA